MVAELGQTKHYAYLLDKSGKSSPADVIAEDRVWYFFEGNDLGFVADRDVLCFGMPGVGINFKKIDDINADVDEVQNSKCDKSREEHGVQLSKSESQGCEQNWDNDNDDDDDGTSSSSSSSSQGSVVEESSQVAQVGTAGAGRVASKMLVRAGWRCACHYVNVMDCETQKLSAARKRKFE